MFNFGQEPTTLLLIDDDPISREVMATVLTMSGYAVHTAEDGAGSVALLEASVCTPDAILMDAQMPGLSGAPLIAALRARSQAKVFAISGSSAPEEVAAAADGFLQKPFVAEELRRALREQSESTGSGTAPLEPFSDPADGEPVLSATILEQLRSMMPEAAVKEIYATVVADLTARQTALEQALAAGNEAEVRRIGHAIKGGCGMTGAMQAARLGARLEAFSTGLGGDELGDHATLPQALHAATADLERMLEAEFPVR
jgi:CheY-like chemotaxis protein